MNVNFFKHSYLCAKKLKSVENLEFFRKGYTSGCFEGNLCCNLHKKGGKRKRKENGKLKEARAHNKLNETKIVSY